MFSLNPSSGVPIYRQIVDQIRRQCATGALAEGDLLPSVRSIATSLGINPMTVSKAYSQLEAEGLVVRKRGVGMAVTKQPDSPDGASDATSRTNKPDAAFTQDSAALVSRAKELGLSQTELIDHITDQWSNT